MTASLYVDLAWLPAPPADFTARCRKLATDDAPGRTARALANHALDENQAARLGRALTAAMDAGGPAAPLLPLRLAIVGNATMDLLPPLLVSAAARHGLALQVTLAAYGQVAQAAFDPAGAIYACRPDAVLFAIDHRGFELGANSGDAQAERDVTAAAVEQLAAMREAVRQHSDAICVVQTLAPPPEQVFGGYDAVVPGTARRVAERFNQALADSLAGTPDLLLDVAFLAQTVGLATWHSPALWNLAKLAFDASCMPLYAEHVARLLAAARGRSRKCLVLDLDNTVWGGVIGDDGLAGIRVAQGDAAGEAHLAVQRMALDLRARGIVLAVCSKNEDETARLPFREHPEMLLREHHLAVFQANWQDKATNIAAIADELALGLDALVFLDDNPAERALVREFLPEVAVPELPGDPALYARTLAAAGYFESVGVSQEDRARAEMYQSNARRAALQKQVGCLDDWLASLQMEVTFAPFDAVGRTRIVQLINKSNQFNLTTRRYSETEVAQLEREPGVFTLQARLTDTLGDNGMISVVICRAGQAGCWTIDTWLMSCRVLGRHVEQAMLCEVMQHARAMGVTTIMGVYHPTARNAIVKDHYARLGFELEKIKEDGTSVWTLATDAEMAHPAIRVRRAGRMLEYA